MADNFDDLEETVYEADPTKLRYADSSAYEQSGSYGGGAVRRSSGVKPGSFLVIILIVLANTIAGIMCIMAHSNHFDTGGLNYEYVHNNKEYIRIITYMFLHANFMHYANNMIALIVYGFRLEPKIGPLKTAIIYFGSGIGAGLFSVNMSHLVNPDRIVYAGGASGAIFGVMCATLFTFIMRNKENRKRDAIIAIAIIVVYAVASNSANVDIWGHIGGGITGGLLALLLVTKKHRIFEEHFFSKLIAIIITVAFCAIGIGRAGIGETTAQLQDSRIDEVKAQGIYQGLDLTMGECFEKHCSDTKWDVFTTTDKKKVVEFSGNTSYMYETQKIYIQFTFDDIEDYWYINYIELGGKSIDGDGFDDLLYYWNKDYLNELGYGR